MSFFTPQLLHLRGFASCFCKAFEFGFLQSSFTGFAFIFAFLEAGLICWISQSQAQGDGILLLCSGFPALLPSLLIFSQTQGFAWPGWTVL